MKRMSVVGAVFLVLLFSMNVMAQDDEYAYNDILEFAIYGGIGLPGGDLTDWGDTLALGAKASPSIGFDFGYFVTPAITVGISFVYTSFGLDTDANTDFVSNLNHRTYEPSLYAKYHFVSETNILPYLKAQVGLSNPKFVTAVQEPGQPPRYRELSYSTSLSLTGGAGVFYYVHDYGGIFLEANYHYGFTDSAEKDYAGTTYVFGSNLQTIDIHAGIRVIVGGGE